MAQAGQPKDGHVAWAKRRHRAMSPTTGKQQGAQDQHTPDNPKVVAQHRQSAHTSRLA